MWVALKLFGTQLRSPILLLLIAAVAISVVLGEQIDAGIILVIIVISATLGFWQERRAGRAIEKLAAMVHTTASVLREGKAIAVPLEHVIPGDVVLLAAGDTVPGDCRLIDATDLHIDEAPLTGESFPVEKQSDKVAPDAVLSRRTNCLFLGSHVVSGQGKALVVKVGRETVFGQISDRLRQRHPETEFERGVRRFGYLLMEITLFLVLAIFAINVFFHRPVVEALLFSLALAVGMTPQLLPAIISINLARGAQELSKAQVIVKHLPSIENFGSMDVLCSDKTGTLTEGLVRLQQAADSEGNDNPHVLELAFLNAFFETGFTNPIDKAIREHQTFDTSHSRKLDEVPYDFLRKRLSVLVEHDGKVLLITKGAVANVLHVCSQVEQRDGSLVSMTAASSRIEQLYREYSGRGYRTLGVAYRRLDASQTITREDERNMIFAGFLILSDPLKAGIDQTIRDLADLGVRLKLVTGDNVLVATQVSQQIGLTNAPPLTGSQMHVLSDDALRQAVGHTDVFAEIEPNQKERLILALKHAGHVVGYLGDGINDASALHAADVGISVDSAVDVAREAADIVLLKSDLNVLLGGVRGGRLTFANTLKYVFMATSANFGNMFSMAGASLFLPFLPLLPKQVLLLNLLTDLPEMTIAGDNVDPEAVEMPRRWDIQFIRRFMLVFGLLSSVFDALTFAALILILRADEAMFRTGWFVESLISACLIVLVLRTRRPFFRSRPGSWLLGTSLAVIAGSVILSLSPLAPLFGFVPLGVKAWALILGIVGLFVLSTEVAKRQFYASPPMRS